MSPKDLPLIERVNREGYYAPDSAALFPLKEGKRCGGFDEKPKIPTEPLLAGEQYRFHFDATRCIGCECCVVACNEQNGNPAEVNWRRVGEVEGGSFPFTSRFYLSMGCNHCLDPACLTGCPVDAYEKDPQTGIVQQKEDACIGCQYCIWNCPYGVPQYNPERKMVSKCDMCHGRLALGQEPACVAACPEQAITIEKVNIEQWRRDHQSADAPGMPDSGITISTTRITLPEDFPKDTAGVNQHRLEPEKPHWPLVFMTVLTQLSVGGFLSLWTSGLLSHFSKSFAFSKNFMGIGALATLFVAFLALATSVLHLGRPIYAFRALKMWRRSWLSREVLFFSIFSGLGTVYALLAMQELIGGGFRFDSLVKGGLGALVGASGIAGVLSSGYIYMVPARPAWNSFRTPLRFFLTAFLLGPLFTVCVSSLDSRALSLPLLPFLGTAVGASLFQAGLLLSSLFHLIQEESSELNGTALLLTRRFRPHFLTRLALLVLGGCLLPVALIYARGAVEETTRFSWIALSGLSFVLSLASELIGRYLFFVTVVPKNMAGSFFR